MCRWTPGRTWRPCTSRFRKDRVRRCWHCTPSTGSPSRGRSVRLPRPCKPRGPARACRRSRPHRRRPTCTPRRRCSRGARTNPHSTSARRHTVGTACRPHPRTSHPDTAGPGRTWSGCSPRTDSRARGRTGHRSPWCMRRSWARRRRSRRRIRPSCRRSRRHSRRDRAPPRLRHRPAAQRRRRPRTGRNRHDTGSPRDSRDRPCMRSDRRGCPRHCSRHPLRSRPGAGSAWVCQKPRAPTERTAHCSESRHGRPRGLEGLVSRSARTPARGRGCRRGSPRSRSRRRPA